MPHPDRCVHRLWRFPRVDSQHVASACDCRRNHRDLQITALRHTQAEWPAKIKCEFKGRLMKFALYRATRCNPRASRYSRNALLVCLHVDCASLSNRKKHAGSPDRCRSISQQILSRCGTCVSDAASPRFRATLCCRASEVPAPVCTVTRVLPRSGRIFSASETGQGALRRNITQVER